MRITVRLARFLGFAIVCLAAAAAAAQTPYPKVNLAAGYELDPAWPRAPGGRTWRSVTGLAVDAQDRVFVANRLAPPVQVYAPDGMPLDGWGEAHLVGPHFLRLDPEGQVWVADVEQHVVQKFTPSGQRLLVLGTLNEPGEDQRHFNKPTDVAVTPAGDVFVADGYGNNRIVHFDRQGRFVKAFGSLGQQAGQLAQPHSLVLDSQGRLYVAERANCRIQVFDQEGRSLACWNHLVNPWGLWLTPRDELLVCGTSPQRWRAQDETLGIPPTDQLVMKFDTQGKILELWAFPLPSDELAAPGTLNWAHGIAADSKGNLYLGEVAATTSTHRVQRFLRLPPDR